MYWSLSQISWCTLSQVTYSLELLYITKSPSFNILQSQQWPSLFSLQYICLSCPCKNIDIDLYRFTAIPECDASVTTNLNANVKRLMACPAQRFITNNWIIIQQKLFSCLEIAVPVFKWYQMLLNRPLLPQLELLSWARTSSENICALEKRVLTFACWTFTLKVFPQAALPVNFSLNAEKTSFYKFYIKFRENLIDVWLL